MWLVCMVMIIRMGDYVLEGVVFGVVRFVLGFILYFDRRV